MLILSGTSYGDELSLINFFAPGPGVKNTYSCEFPCDHIEISSHPINDKSTIELEEIMYFSDTLKKKNLELPLSTANKYTLHLMADRIVKSDGSKESVLLMKPLQMATNWEIKGIMGEVKNSQDLSKLKEKQVSWACKIASIYDEKLFIKDRKVIKVECLSNFTPKEVLTWKYASGIGLIENSTAYEAKDGSFLEKKIMTITKHDEPMR